MELRDLKSLTVLVDVGSYGRAADILGIDASTLSRRVSNLEDELGVLLLERTRSGVRITPSGHEVVRLARRILGDLDEIRENAAQSGSAQKGNIKLATQPGILGKWMREALESYRQSHPHIGIQLYEASDLDIATGLKDRLYDVGILIAPTESPRLGTQQLWSEKLMLAVSERHKLASRKGVAWGEIQSECMLVRGWIVSQAFRELEVARVGPSARFRTHQAGCVALLGLVSIDEGVMITLEAHRELAFPGVVFLEILEPDASISVDLAWDVDVEDPVVGSFVAFMRDRRFASPSGLGRTGERAPAHSSVHSPRATA